MGNTFKKGKNIKVFNDVLNIDDLKKSIIKSKVIDDFDMMIFIDCTKSNLFMDGSSLHDVSKTYCKSNRYVLSNPYLFILDILKDFVGSIGSQQMQRTAINNEESNIISVENENNIFLYFFGTRKANISSNKLQNINIIYNSISKKIDSKKSNIYTNMDDIINGYIAGIYTLLDKSNSYFFGSNYMDVGTPLINIFDEAINMVKNTGKFTIVLLILNDLYTEINSIYILKKIIEMSKYPIAIICVYVGNKDIKILEGIDDFNAKKLEIPKKKLAVLDKERKFDNFQFVALKKIIKRTLINKYIIDEMYKYLFMEIPRVYQCIQQKNILSYVPNKKNKNNILLHNNSKLTNTGSILVLDLLEDNINNINYNTNIKKLVKEKDTSVNCTKSVDFTNKFFLKIFRRKSWS